jgi:hypothetical protein
MHVAFFAQFPYFEKEMDGGACDHLSVCVPVYSTCASPPQVFVLYVLRVVSFHFYVVLVLSTERRRLVLPITSYLLMNLFDIDHFEVIPIISKCLRPRFSRWCSFVIK